MLKSAITQANSVVIRNQAAQVSPIILERKISALDKAWSDTQDTFVTMSRLAIEGPEMTADKAAFAEDGLTWAIARDDADAARAANQSILPPASTTADEVLFLDDVKIREKGLMDDMINAIEATLRDPNLTAAILKLQLSLLEEAVGHFEKVREASDEIVRKDPTK